MLGAPRDVPGAGGSAGARGADVILSLDWVDLAGALKARSARSPAAKMIQVSLDSSASTTAGAWTIRLCRRSICSSPPIPTPSVPSCSQAARRAGQAARRAAAARSRGRSRARRLHQRAHRAGAARRSLGERPTSLTHVPISWEAAGGRSAIRSTTSAPTAAAVSAAARAFPSARRWRCGAPAACRSRCCGDGDFLMGVTALWTAVHYKSRCSSSSPTIARSSTTNCIRSGWRACATGRWKTAGSASGSPTRRSTSPRLPARKARRLWPDPPVRRSRAGAGKRGRRRRGRRGRGRRCPYRARL